MELIYALVAAVLTVGALVVRKAARPQAQDAYRDSPLFIGSTDAPPPAAVSDLFSPSPAPLPSLPPLGAMPRGSVRMSDLRVGDAVYLEMDGKWKLRLVVRHPEAALFDVTWAFVEKGKRRVERFAARLEGSWYDGLFRHLVIVVGGQVRLHRATSDGLGFQTMSTPHVVRVLVEAAGTEVRIPA